VRARSLEPYAPVTKEWLDSLDSEHDNIRVTLDRLPRQGETQLALALAEAVWRFWKMRGHQSEAQRRLESLLSVDEEPTVARGHALNAAAGMAVDNGQYETGRLYAELALAIHRGHGDAWGVARSTYMLGYAAIESDDFEAAKSPLRGHGESHDRTRARAVRRHGHVQPPHSMSSESVSEQRSSDKRTSFGHARSGVRTSKPLPSTHSPGTPTRTDDTTMRSR
jgi:hypothetical protein